MDLTPDLCYKVLLARDARYDGRFFTCVKSTGIYCRCVCPATPPRVENCLFVASAAAAQATGYRPCLRCRPESAPSSAAWGGTSATVSRALGLIEAGAMDEGGVESLAARLGVGARQLRRLFMRHVGASPVAVAQTRRVLLASQLIHQTALSMTEVALASGFGSVRRFNEAFRALFGRAPGELRRKRSAAGPDISLMLAYRPPYDWDAMLAFLALRSVPGVERVAEGRYSRTIHIGSDHGTITVSHEPASNALRATIRFPRLGALPLIIDRLRGMFDLGADPAVIAATLALDPALAPHVQARPGLRVPGGWDAFEVAVRAVLGQQVTVRGAVGLAARLVERLGDPLDEAMAEAGLDRLFPEPERFSHDAVQAIGMPGSRAAALVHLARAHCADPALFERQRELEQTIGRLCALPGVGPWTAHYIAMRALRESDAFPASDVALQRALAKDGRRPPATELERRAHAWRPWRSYAVLHLWTAEAQTARRSPKENGTRATAA